MAIVFDRGLPDKSDEEIYRENCDAAFLHVLNSYQGAGQSVYSDTESGALLHGNRSILSLQQSSEHEPIIAPACALAQGPWLDFGQFLPIITTVTGSSVEQSSRQLRG